MACRCEDDLDAEGRGLQYPWTWRARSAQSLIPDSHMTRPSLSSRDGRREAKEPKCKTKTEDASNTPGHHHFNSWKAHRNLSVSRGCSKQFFQCTGNRPGAQTLQKTDASPHHPQNPINYQGPYYHIVSTAPRANWGLSCRLSRLQLSGLDLEGSDQKRRNHFPEGPSTQIVRFESPRSLL